MTEIEKMKKRVADLEDEVKRLKAEPRQVFEYHYHYHQPLYQLAPQPYYVPVCPQPTWPTLPLGPTWTAGATAGMLSGST
jgi:hypothetical protein